MAVALPREKWTEERLDDLNKKVDKGFEDVKGEFKDVRDEMRGGFARVDGEIRELRSDMNERFDKMNDRFEAMQRTLVGGLFVVIAAIIGSSIF